MEDKLFYPSSSSDKAKNLLQTSDDIYYRVCHIVLIEQFVAFGFSRCPVSRFNLLCEQIVYFTVLRRFYHKSPHLFSCSRPCHARHPG